MSLMGFPSYPTPLSPTNVDCIVKSIRATEPHDFQKNFLSLSTSSSFPLTWIFFVA